MTIESDGSAFQRVMTNLISNAIKFTEEGGAVTVRIWTGDAFAADGASAGAERTPGQFARHRSRSIPA
ncbi:MAG: hypothetical protein U5R48_12370 [Gammaproteobacteria bacterium]|nr:hypothetical protein [Gammaproteobacteria bacterium]